MQFNEIQCKVMKYNVMQSNIMPVSQNDAFAIKRKTMQVNEIHCNSLIYNANQLNTMQGNEIQSDAKQYNAGLPQ